jgi:hypothetical protein
MMKKYDTWMKVSRGYESMLNEAIEVISKINEMNPDKVLFEACEFIGCAMRVQVSATAQGHEMLINRMKDREWEEARDFIRQNTR